MMMVRTYGRRNRGIGRTYSDTTLTAEEDDVALEEDQFRDSFSSISQDTPQDFYNFPFSSSQESSPPRWSSQDNNNTSQRSNNSVPLLPPGTATTTRKTHFTDSVNDVVRRPKKQRKQQGCSGPSMPATSTLMEAQEFGEMMEHVDEVNFAIDGLKRGSQVRIRRASLLSLLSICGTAQQRRLLRTHGMAKTIIDAIIGLSFDDSPSNLAAAALFYILTGDGQDDHLLESNGCIRFLIKLLKPVSSTGTDDKTRKIGSKLLALRKDTDTTRDTTKISDSSSSAILSKVQEILVSCKEMKSHCGDDAKIGRPELSPKWIALLAMEKACLSKISFEDTTGTVRKTGGNFKENLRELGGLDAVFEVIMNCYSVMEGWKERCSPSIQDTNHHLDLQNFVLLLKCLKIMENATFLSKDNQSHLLGMKGNLNSHGSRLSFIKVVIFLIKILSELYLLKSSATSAEGKSSKFSDESETGHISELALLTDSKVRSNEVIVISSSETCSSIGLASSDKSFNASQHSSWLSFDQLGRSESNVETTTTSDNCLLKMRSCSSLSGSCSGTLRSFSGGTPLSSNGSRTKSGLVEIPNSRKDDKYEFLEDGEDPYAFDEDAFELSKWDLLSGKQKKSQTKKRRVINRGLKDGGQYQTLMSQEESSNGENCKQLSSNGGNHQRSSNGERHCSPESSCSHAIDKEKSTLLADCLLTAVKVLMNLTNDNPVGCRQIASCGGLETMSMLIANHFPSFSSSFSPPSGSFDAEHQGDRHLTDQELDFLVAILGLLVNLVEKDGHNRSQLAAARVPLPNSDGLEEESHGDVITLLCSIFLANRGAGDAAGEGNAVPWNDEEEAMLEGEKEAEKMIVEAYAALLLAFLSTESKSIRAAIAECLPDRNIAVLVPVLERFVAFHLSLNMISPETHKAVSEVIESCRIP